MPDLLLELRSEEIPARMQRKAAGDLRKMLTDALVDAGLTYEGAQEYWTPRRLVLDIRGLTARSRDVREEIKGPSVKAPEAAIQGFLRKAGLLSIADAHVHADPKKGDFYVAHKVTAGRAAEAMIAEAVPRIVREFPWPKSMRWGAASAKPGSLRWVRPLQSILCTFGPETEDPVVVEFDVDGIRSGNTTVGHRFHAPGTITVKRFDDYAAKLEAAFVVLSAERRKSIIRTDAENLAFASGLELVADEGLLEEVSGLVEWPVVLMGEFEAAFLEIPAEVIRLTIRANQKCFVTRPSGHGAEAADPSRLASPAPQDDASRLASPAPQDEGGSALSNRFLLTANIEAKDGGADIARGNGKVVRARLSDALYFWRTDQSDLPDLGLLAASAQKFNLDLKKPLDQRMARLDHLNVTFHAKLGTQGERVERIRRLAREIAPLVGADSDLADRAAVLAKADLQTEVVGEFPELQGAMGRKYAALQGEHPSVAAAVEEHYKPQGPSDRVPSEPVSIAVALADKLDTLVGFWAIDEKPTGSKDPYALRRAALGVIRIVAENHKKVPLISVAQAALLCYFTGTFHPKRDHTHSGYNELVGERLDENGFLVGGDWDKRPFSLFVNWDGYFNDTGRNVSLAELAVADQLDEAEEAQAYANLNELKVRLGAMEEMAFLPFSENEREAEGIKKFYLARKYQNEIWLGASAVLCEELIPFFHDRLKVYLRDQGARHDLIDAVLAAGPPSPLWGGDRVGGAGASTSPALPPPSIPPHKGEGGVGVAPDAGGVGANDDLLSIVRRVEALGRLLATEDGKNLLAGTKRAVNILAAEEKKGTAVASGVDPKLFRDEAEIELFEAVNGAEVRAAEAVRAEDFSAAMVALSSLRDPVDRFFERVLVNDEDQGVRANRLALLARIRAVTGQVADFSKIAG